MIKFISIIQEGLGRLFFIIPSSPEVAQIEITNRCNFNCLMCQRIPLKVPLRDIDYSLYKKIISKLGKVNEVILTGWGEPLMHPKVIEMIKYAKRRNKKVSITTNGSLLTGKIINDLIGTKIDSISFSVDEIVSKSKTQTHPVQKQLGNIKEFIKVLRDKKAGTKIIIQSTLHKGKEKNLNEVVKWAEEIGADMVNVNRLDLRFNKTLKRPNFQEEANFMEKLDQISNKYPVLIEFKSHAAFNGFLRNIYKLLIPFMGRGGRHCLRIYNYVYINNRGEVTPCCALPNWPVGNILKEDLDKIWNSDIFNKFREHDYQRKICGKCDVLEINQYVK